MKRVRAALRGFGNPTFRRHLGDKRRPDAGLQVSPRDAIDPQRNTWCLSRDSESSWLRALWLGEPDAAISIGANVAEDTGRNSDSDFARSVTIARGSTHELEFHVLVASDLGLMSAEQATEMLGQIRRIGRMLYALAKRLRAS